MSKQDSREPLHPVTGLPFSPLERILWRVRMAGHEATVMRRGFLNTEDVSKSINGDLMFGLTNQALIIVSKFREVWDNFGALAKSESRVVPTRRVVQPLIDRIDVWPGLPAFRNTTLAHAYLDRSGRLLPPTALINEGKVPTHHAEAILLLEVVIYASVAILQVFEDVYLPIDSTTRDQPGEPIGPGPGIQLGTQIDAAIGELLARVDAECETAFGSRLGGQVFDGFRVAMAKPSRVTQNLR